MKAIILAAGKGSRLRPLTYAIPKPLLPIAGKPTIEYVIENLLTSGKITEIYVAISHERETIDKYFRNTATSRQVKIDTVNVMGWETGGDLKAAAYEADIDGPFVACFGDNLTQINMDEMIVNHEVKDFKVSMALFEVPEEDKQRFGIAEIGEAGNILKFVEKPSPPDSVRSRLANAGYYVIEEEVLDMIPYGRVKLEESVIPRLVERRRVGGHVIKPPYWLDIGNEVSYKMANKMILDKEGIIPPPSR